MFKVSTVYLIQACKHLQKFFSLTKVTLTASAVWISGLQLLKCFHPASHMTPASSQHSNFSSQLSSFRSYTLTV